MGTTYAKPYTAGEPGRPAPVPMRIGNAQAGWKDPRLKTRNVGWNGATTENKPKSSKRVMDCSQRTNVGWKFAPSKMDYATQWARTNSGWAPRGQVQEWPMKKAPIAPTKGTDIVAQRKKRLSRGVNPGLGAQQARSAVKPKAEPMRFTKDRKHGLTTANAGWSSFQYGSDAIPLKLMHQLGSRPQSAATMRNREANSRPSSAASRPTSAIRPSSATRTSRMHFALDPHRSLVSRNGPTDCEDSHFGPFNYKGEDYQGVAAVRQQDLSNTQEVLRNLINAVHGGVYMDSPLERVLQPAPPLPQRERPRSASMGPGAAVPKR